MGRAIEDRKDISKLQMEMKELQDVVAELSDALINTKQVHQVDLHDEVPAGRRKKTTTRKTTVLEKDSAEA